MSQTPESIAAALADESQAARYRIGWKALSELIGEGRSFSGHEKNCCFLNTGQTRFADVSSATGLDFDDDGRAVAVCDWDFDGRPDFWVTNRTAPRVRLLRNAGSGGHWIALRLTGTTCNRDAIGARVVVELPDGTERSRTVQSGDGFLAQSSKWLHFGLGAAEALRKVYVKWPDNSSELIQGVALDRFHTITQGVGVATPWTPPKAGAVPLEPASLPAPEPDPATRTWLIGRIPLPPVEGLPASPGQPFLIVLWSNTCALCRAELTEWAAHATAIRAAGLGGMVLSVDALLGESIVPPPAGIPFAAGTATPDIAEALDLFHRTFLELQQPLPVPASFLLDREGRVAAIYKGRIKLETLYSDLKLLDRSEAEARDSAVPFPGRWASNPFPPQPERLAEALAAAGHPDWRDRYLSEYATRFQSPDVQLRLGATLLEEGRTAEAVAAFARLFESAPRDVAAHRQAGLLLLQRDLAPPARAHLLAARPGFADDPDFRFNLGLAEAANRNAAEALKNFQAAADLNPADPAAHFQIGNVLHATKRSEEAIPHYREALRLRPGWALPANNLAWILATHPNPKLRNGAEAVRLLEPITIAEQGRNSPTLATLAAAFAETGAFDRAITTATQALEVATQAGSQREMQGLQSALQRYRSAQPMRSPP